MEKITKLTPKQKAYLPTFRQEYLDQAISGKRTDRTRLESAIADAYECISKKKPLVIILQSPAQAMMAIKFIETFAKAEQGEELRSQLDSQLYSQLYSQLRSQLDSQLYSEKIWNGNYLWGSQDLNWIAFYKFAETIGVKFNGENTRRLDIVKSIGFECEWWWPYEGICFVSERPVETHWDDARLHNEHGPSVLYADGFALYSWRGTQIPENWIKDKASLTAKVALTHKNIEQRRCACEILGWNNILKELNAKTIEKDADPQIGELVEVQIPDIGKEKFLRVQCGTGREFAMPVPPEMKTALQANAWTWALEDFQYKPETRT